MTTFLFSDGTTWGPDTQKQSEYLSGWGEGEKYAISQIKQLIREQNKEELLRLIQMNQEGKIDGDSLKLDKAKSFNWRSGFVASYGLVLMDLQPYDPKSGNRLLVDDKTTFDEFASRLKNIECNRSKFMEALLPLIERAGSFAIRMDKK